MEKRNVFFARRESGGGAVYHDPGNTNFSFITGDSDSIRENCTEMIAQSLGSFGIRADKGDRNDLYVKGKKISGSASKYSSGKVMHHGTLLIDADLDALDYFLTALDYNSGQLKSLGTASVRSSVINLNELEPFLNHESVCQAIINKSQDFFGKQTEISIISLSDMKKIDEVVEYRSKIMNWNWLYGSTPAFSVTSVVKLSGIDTVCSFAVKKGIIREIQSIEELITEERKNVIRGEFVGKRCDVIL
jgi:lipoate-protein ligase A